MAARRASRVAVLAVLGAALGSGPAAAEPHFLAKQYARCATCHFSPTGGGLLTAYGRALSRQELSTTGRSPAGKEPEPGRGEESFLGGILGTALGPLHLGIDLRPARLRLRGAVEQDRDFWMRADLEAAVQQGPWTFYGEIGRQPLADGSRLHSYEHWLQYSFESGTSIRAGRFLPPFGVRVADHTSYSRADIGLGRDSQMYGVELSDTGERHLFQFAIGPGYAESILEDDGSRGFLASARAQFDLRSRQVLVLSGMFRGASDRAAESWLGSVAYGFAPTSRLTLWTQLVERATDGWHGTPEYTLFHQLSFEVYRGVWLQLAPQIQTAVNNVSGGKYRWSFGLDWLPRTHWNVITTWTRDVVRQSGGIHVDAWLIQLHMYL